MSTQSCKDKCGKWPIQRVGQVGHRGYWQSSIHKSRVTTLISSCHSASQFSTGFSLHCMPLHHKIHFQAWREAREENKLHERESSPEINSKYHRPRKLLTYFSLFQLLTTVPQDAFASLQSRAMRWYLIKRIASARTPERFLYYVVFYKRWVWRK